MMSEFYTAWVRNDPDAGKGPKLKFWLGYDNPEQYERAKKRYERRGDTSFAEYYDNNPIRYNLNSHGYREKEFDSLDWENSIVCIGDSHVAGIGHHIDRTIPYYLNQITNMPTINLGIGAASTFIFTYLLAQIPKCKAVVVTQARLQTFTKYDDNGQPIHMGPESNDEGLKLFWEDDYNSQHHHHLQQKRVRAKMHDKIVEVPCYNQATIAAKGGIEARDGLHLTEYEHRHIAQTAASLLA